MPTFITQNQYQGSLTVAPGRFDAPFDQQDSSSELFVPSPINYPGSDWVPFGITAKAIALHSNLPITTYNFWFRIGGVDVAGPFSLSSITGNGTASISAAVIPPSDANGGDLNTRNMTVRNLQIGAPANTIEQTFAYSPTNGSTSQVYGGKLLGGFDTAGPSTVYSVFQGQPFAVGPNEFDNQIIWPLSGTFKTMLAVYQWTNALNDSTVTISLRKNGSYSTLATVATNNVLSHVVFDNVHTTSVSPGDLLTWETKSTGPSDHNHVLFAAMYVEFVPV